MDVQCSLESDHLRGLPPAVMFELISVDSFSFITLTVCVSIFTDMFLCSVLVPVFPFMLENRFHITADRVQFWISVLLAVYGAALLTGSPIFGIYADKLSHRRLPFLVGLLLIIVSTVILCLATSIEVLIVGRILQGLSASVVWVVGMAIVADTTDPDKVAQAFSYVGIASASGNLVAPVLGGLVYGTAGHYPMFAMCFAVLAVDVALRLVMIEKCEAIRWIAACSDQEGGISNPAGHVTRVSETPRDSDPNKGHRLSAFISMWNSPRMLTTVFGEFVTASIIAAFDTTLALFVNQTFQWSASKAGLGFLALLLPNALGPVFGMIVDRHGARWVSAAGFLVMIPPLALMRLVDHNEASQVALLMSLLVLVGTGVVMTLTGLYAELAKICDAMDSGSSEKRDYAQTYGISEIAWALAGLTSPFMAGSIYSAAGWGTLGWSLSIMCAVAATLVCCFTGRKVPSQSG